MKTQGWINCRDNLVPEVVLVEDDSEVRSIWLTVATRLKLRFAAYAWPADFLQDLYRFDDRTHFYLDQDFGNQRGEGLRLARVLRDKFQSQIFLITSYPRKNFISEIRLGLINDVFGKYPWPFTIRNALSDDEDSPIDFKSKIQSTTIGS